MSILLLQRIISGGIIRDMYSHNVLMKAARELHSTGKGINGCRPETPYFSSCDRHSPRADGMDQEAALLSSAEASDASSSGRQGEDLLAVGASTAGFVEADAAAETDSCGYEGDVGESARIIPSVRRLASVVVVAPPGMPTKVRLVPTERDGRLRSGVLCIRFASWSTC